MTDQIKVYDEYGKFPSIPNVFRRDEETHKIIPGEWACPEFDYLQNNTWVFTEKIHGMNTRIIFDNGELSFRGRTDKAQMPNNLLEELNRLFSPHEDKFESACFYGEGYGAGIQKGGKYRQDQGFALFDIKVGTWYLKRHVVKEIATKMGIEVVPFTFTGTLWEGIEAVQGGRGSQYGDFFAEGLVGVPSTPLRCRNGSRVIVKIKHRDFYMEGS